MLCLLLPFWFLRGETASAATTPSYTVAFDYTHTYTYGSGAGTRKETGSGASGNAYLSNGGTIKSDTVNIQISGYNERRITVTDASGRTVGSGSSSVHLSGDDQFACGRQCYDDGFLQLYRCGGRTRPSVR